MSFDLTLPDAAVDHAADPPTLLEGDLGYVIYPMPVFVTLETDDVVGVARWYCDALGFGVLFVGPQMGGQPMIAHLRRAKYQDVLVVPRRGGAGIAGVSFAAGVPIESLASRARSVDAVGASAVDGPHPTPWGAPELYVTDPEGNRLTFFGVPEHPPAGTIEEAMEAAAEKLRSGARE